MAKLIQVPYQSDIVIPVETAQSVQLNRENPISLQALGLLVNLLSYPTTWELHKSELYKRFGKNKEDSVKTAWNDLIGANYIIEFKYRSGRKWEYVYYFRKVPFTPEEKTEIIDNAKNEYGEIWGLDFQVLKMESGKPRSNQIPKLNKKPKLNNKELYKDNIDDDMRTSQQVGKDSAQHNEKNIDFVISSLREATKNELTDRSFKAVVRKVVDKYNQGKVNSFRDYLVTALANKIHELELRRMKDKAKLEILQNKLDRVESKKKNILSESSKIEKVPFYNWLE